MYSWNRAANEQALCPPSSLYMSEYETSVELYWKPKNPDKNPPQCHYDHHKSKTENLGVAGRSGQKPAINVLG